MIKVVQYYYLNIRTIACDKQPAARAMGEFFGYINRYKIDAWADIFEADTRKLFSKIFQPMEMKSLEKNLLIIIVTSPQYGDNHLQLPMDDFPVFP